LKRERTTMRVGKKRKREGRRQKEGRKGKERYGELGKLRYGIKGDRRPCVPIMY